MTAIPSQRSSAELRRAATHLDARAEVELRQALRDDSDRLNHRKRAWHLRTLANDMRREADAVDRREEQPCRCGQHHCGHVWRSDVGSAAVALLLALLIGCGVFLLAVWGGEAAMCAAHGDRIKYCGVGS